MKRTLPLFLLLWLSALSGLSVQKLSWDADFPVDAAAWEQASGIIGGAVYDPATIREAITRLEQYLSSSGRYFVKIPFPELIPVADTLIELRFSLREVLPSDQMKLRLAGMRYFSEDRLKEMLLISEDKRFAIKELDRVIGQILDICHSRGFLFARVELDSLVLEQELTAWLKVSEGKVFKPEKIFFQGNKYTRDRSLLKLSGIMSVRVITPQALEEAAQNILRKPYIKDALVEPITGNSLLIRVEEGRMTYLEGVVGYNGKQKELSGLLKLKFLNLWGSDRSLNLNWRQDSSRSELELGYHESGPGSIPLAGDLLLQRTSQDTLWIKSNISAKIYGYYGYHKLGLELGSSDNLIDPSLARGPSQRIRAASLGAFWELDSAYPVGNPAKGYQGRLAYRFLNSKDRGWNGAFELDWANFIPLGKRLVGAISLHFRDLDDVEARDYDLYQMGGYEKLRGYNDGEFQSWRLGWVAWELRWRLDPVSRLHLFFDHGLLARRLDGPLGPRTDYRTDLLGFGLGIRIGTRIGILGIDYALGNREDGLSGLGAGMVHAGLNASF